MGIGLVIIEKEYNGESWSNTHAFSTAGGSLLIDSDMVAIGIDQVQAGTPAALGGAGFDPATALFVSSLLSFERALTFTPINFTRVYVTDGKINNILDPNAFAVATLGVQGLRTLGGETEVDIIPGNVTLQINRVPAGFSHRQGRMFLRGALEDGSVRFAGKGGVAFTGVPIADGYRSLLAATVAASGISRFYGAGAAGLVYGIPQYVTTALIGVQRKGQLNHVVPIGSLVLAGPVGRQMKRGKKKKKVA